MIIDEIVLHNFGTYSGRQILHLKPPSKGKPVVLIGGLNGVGKTTLLDAFQLALFGKMARCSNRGNNAYENFLLKSINRSVPPTEGAALELQFRHVADGKEHTYRIHRSWAQNGKSVKERLEVIHNGKLDQVLTDTWNEQVNEFIPSDISHLFFFDGEKIEQLANREKTPQLLTTAIQSLLGLNILDRLATDLVVLERRKRSSLKNKEAIELNNQIESLEKEVLQLEKQREEITQKQASLQNEIDLKTKEYTKAENQFKREGGELYEMKTELVAKKETINKAIAETKASLIELAASPAPLLLVKDLLGKVSEQAKREETAKQASILSNILIERDNALVQELKSSMQASAIIKQMEDFLRNDRKQRKKSAKKVDSYLDLDKETNEKLNALLTTGLDDVSKTVKQATERFEALQSELDVIDRKIAGIPSKETIEVLQKKLNNVKNNLHSLKAKYEHLEEEKAKIIFHHTQKKALFTKLLEKKVESDYSHDGIARTINHSQKVRRTLQRFRTEIVTHNIHNLEKLILECFTQLLRKKSLLHDLKIDPESFEVRLYSANGKELPAERFSAGERQLLAASILWGLARASGRPIPTIIDTPLGRLDSSHRTQLVNHYFPYASHQTLLLSTDEEINEKYYKKIKSWVGHSYTLDFDDNKGSTEIKKGYFWQ